MEERFEIGSQFRIVVTGPESTGKTELAGLLADHFGGTVIPEYARDYIENLNRPYNFNDVVAIAEEQIRLREMTISQPSNWFFFDTDLIITKVWFDEVFNKCPEWLIHKINEPFMDFYLLCSPDIPWKEDTVRENGGERRDYLFLKYKEELEKYDFSYSVVKGENESRFNHALSGIKEFLAGNSIKK